MSDLRKLYFASSLVVLAATFAAAQVAPPIVCSTASYPPAVRTGTERSGDVVITCTGGQAPAVGSVLPQANISVTLTTNVSSRLIKETITEALLLIDDPQGDDQHTCSPAAGTTCSPLKAGERGASLDGTGINRNVFQGIRQNDNTIVWLAVPFHAPGSTGSRTFRTKNVRAPAGTDQVFAYVSIQNPPVGLQLDTSVVNIAEVPYRIWDYAEFRASSRQPAVNTLSQSRPVESQARR